MTDETNALPNGFNLHRYSIEGILGAGGFGITYRAMHEALENEVAIKEYFPAEWAYRDHNGTTVRANAQGQIPAQNGEPPCYDWGLQRFLDEAKILVQINHPRVVRVRDYFTANGSAYIVMEYEDGESMSTSLQRGGILPEQELHRLLADVLPALEAVHAQGYLHRDLKPSNLYIRSRDNHVMLIDFGAARQALGRRTRSVTSVVTPGYSPIEQYVTLGEDYGPWTDLYALGAVMYRCITGTPPVEAPGRVLKDPVQPAVEAGAGLYSESLLQLIDRAIAVRPEERYQSVAEMRRAMQSAEQNQDCIDFSKVPPIQSKDLDLPSSASGIPLELVPNEPLPSKYGKTSSSHMPFQAPESQPSQFTPQPTRHSRPSQRSPSPLPESVLKQPSTDEASFQPQSHEHSSPLPELPLDDNPGSLPMLEDIWEQMDNKDAPSSLTVTDQNREPTTNTPSFLKENPTDAALSSLTGIPIDPISAGTPATEIPSSQIGIPTAEEQTPSTNTPTLLQRTPHSAVEYLKKLSTASKRKASTHSGTDPATSSFPDEISHDVQLAQPLTNTSDAFADSSIRAIDWKWIALVTLAITGMAGTSLLSYQYYTVIQEQQRQRELEVQEQQEQEAAQRTQQEVERLNMEIGHYIKQARSAIDRKELKRAKLYVDNATKLDPDHPEVVAARTTLSAARQPEAQYKTYTDKTTGMTFHLIEGGCFEIGAPPNERDHNDNEYRQQSCVKRYWISVHEVTNSQYQRFRPRHSSGSLQSRTLNAGKQPVTNVSWKDATAFAEWLSWESDDGKRFRLPTEAEWEFAARAGTTDRYYWGQKLDPKYANFSDRNDPTGASIGNLNDKHAVTAPVGSYKPNAWGLYDILGNVWEWSCSEYSARYNGQENTCSDQPSNKGVRVVRGGSWNNGPGDLRLARRQPRKPDYRDQTIGFRLVMLEK